MGGIGPEGLPRREQLFTNAPLFPVGSDTIRKVLPKITPDNISALTRQHHTLIQSRDPALIQLLNSIYQDYHERERGVGSNSLLDFYAGVVFVDIFLVAQASNQIPKVVSNEERNDIPELLHHERATQEECATNFRVPESAVEKIAYERIRKTAQKDERVNDPDIEVAFGKIILDFAAMYPDDDGAFLVGAAAYLNVMETLWMEEQRQKRLAEIKESQRVNATLSLWPSKEQKEIADRLASVAADELAKEIYDFFKREGQSGQQEAA